MPKNSRRILDKILDKSSKRQQLTWKYWTVAASISYLLSGCLVIPIEFSSRPTQQQTPIGNLQPPDITAQSDTIAQMEAKIRQRINTIRQEYGLNQLQANEKLALVARAYSQQMAEKNFFSHTGPNGDTLAQRVRSAGISYRLVGENLFKSTNAPQPVSLAVEGWMDSPGHRENILRTGFSKTGVGIWRDGNTYYFTQLFMR